MRVYDVLSVFIPHENLTGTGMESARVYSCEYRASNMWIRAYPYITHYFSYGIRTGFFTGKRLIYYECNAISNISNIIQQRRMAVKSKSISYRKMNNINIEQFKNDIRESTTLNNITGSVD